MPVLLMSKLAASGSIPMHHVANSIELLND